MAAKNVKIDQAPPVDRLHVDLSKEKNEELCHWLDNQRGAIIQDRSRFVDRQRDFLSNWDDYLTFVRKGPWDNFPNIHAPLTEIMVWSYFTRLYNLFTNEDTVQLVPRESLDEDMTLALKHLRKWYLWDYINEYRGIKPVAKEIFWDVSTIGFGVCLKNWEHKVRKVIQVEPTDFRREMKEVNAQMSEIEGTGKKLSLAPYQEVFKVVTQFEGTRIIRAPFENCYFPNEIPESNDMNYPDMIGIDSQMSLSDLVVKAEQGIYDKDVVDAMVEEGLKSRHQSSGNLQEASIKEDRERSTGVETSNSKFKTEMKGIRYEFCRYDIDDDHIAEDLVVTRNDSGKILRVTYLNRVSPSGRRPIYKFDCFSKPGQAYSRGVVEHVYSLQEEIDMNRNLRLAFKEIQACPWGVYRSNSSLNNEPIKIAPAKFFPVDNVNEDIRILSFNSSASSLFEEEAQTWQYAERHARVSPLNQGMIQGQVGPQRSTSGVITLLSQMDKEFMPIADSNAQSWRELEMGILEDLDFRIEPQIRMRVLGPMIENEVDPAAFDHIMKVSRSFDLSIQVAKMLETDEFRQQKSQAIYNFLASPSFLHQFGIVTPRGLYRAAKDVLRSYNIDEKLYLDEPKFALVALTLWQEIQVIAQGEVPPMALQDNHELKAEQLQAFFQTPEFQDAKKAGTYPQNVDELLFKTVQKHREMHEMAQVQQQMSTMPAQGGADQLATKAGVGDQQGGRDPNATTSRDIPRTQGKQPEAIAEENGGGPSIV